MLILELSSNVNKLYYIPFYNTKATATKVIKYELIDSRVH